MALDSSILVRCGAGLVRGVRSGGTRVWRGIPFAAPPVGALRFRAPQPVQPWGGEFDASAFGHLPVQPRSPAAAGGSGRRRMDEDSLTLNVCVPDAPDGADPERRGLPVLVWIYGGAFSAGAGANHPGERLARAAGAVVVTLNYRLGAFGFLDFSELSTPDRPFDANVGLLDQIASLEWVRDEISAFGGDPGNVTVVGESAGALSIVALMCVPRAEGLFHRAIAQSPAPEAVLSREFGALCARQFVGFLGAGSDPAEAAAALERATADQLVAAMQALTRYYQEANPGVLVPAPVVDGDLLPRPPMEVFEAGESAPIPLLVGTNDNEGRLFQVFRVFTREQMLPTSTDRLERMFALTDPVRARRVLAAYPGYPSARVRAQIIGDKTFWVPTIALADAHARHSPTFVYRFDQSTPLLRGLGVGATHGVDLGFVFGQVLDPVSPFGSSPAARRTSARMMRLWGSFAADGAPDVRWPRYDEATRATMIIDDVWRVENDPRGYRHRLWAGYEDRGPGSPDGG